MDARFPLMVSLALAALLGPPLTTGQPQAPQPPNLLPNGTFEKGEQGWEPHARSKQTKFSIDRTVTREGRSSLRIDHTEADDSYFNQALTLKAGSRYRLSGWIKTKDVVKAEAQRDGDAGACLSVLGGYVHTEFVSGTKDWTYVFKEFSAEEKTELKLGPRFGHYGKLVTGTAWFADISLVELAALAAAPPAGAPIIVEALIDGPSELRVTTRGLYWINHRNAKPGLHEKHNDPTYVDGREWKPVWGNPRRNARQRHEPDLAASTQSGTAAHGIAGRRRETRRRGH